MGLAYELGKFEHEILALSPTEFARWLAFFRIKREEEKKASRKGGKGTR